jgi:hypothetical protein
MTQNSSSILELQRAAVMQMLNIGGNEQGLGNSQTWKVLVYDNFCKEVVAPLLRIGGLRNHGVTLHLNIENARQPVADVPAVYFLEPTEKNIKSILEDLEKGLYESCYINFASSVTRPLLEDLAKGSLQSRAAQKVAGVFDRYVSFVSLSQSLFSLNLPNTYTFLQSPSSSDQFIEQYLERIVDGLLSVLATMRVLPIIRCPPGIESPMAEMVARKLEERIRELLRTGGPQAAELFSAEARGGVADIGAGASSQRPLLCILARDVDLITMLHHTWTYQAMTHDLFGLRLNKLTVPVEGSDSAAPPKPKSYDVDESDQFWIQHSGSQFPVVGNAVHEAIEDYKKKSASMSSSPGEEDPTAAMAPGLAAAINALPEMTEKKRSIDMHTNIAMALMSEIKARELDKYYEIEDQFASQSAASSIKGMEELMSDTQKGTMIDKLRALMCLYLSKPTIEEAKLQGLIDALAAAGAGSDVDGMAHHGMAYLRHLASIRNMSMPSVVRDASPNQQNSASGSLMGAMARLATGAQAASEGMLAVGMKGLKNIVASEAETPVCQIMDGLMEQKPGLTEKYLYLDPKAAPVPPGGEAPRIRAPFRRGIAFVIGGGNYPEMQSLQEWGQKHGRQVCYGSTDMVAPKQFVEELCELGKSLSSDMR